MTNKGLVLFAGLLAVAAMVACGGGGGETTASAPAEAPAAAPAPAGGGSISGVVTYANGDPDTQISMDADPVCSGLHEGPVMTQQVEATDGNLANVFVYLKEGVTGSYPAPADAVVLDQVGCTYVPHVAGVQTGQKVVIRNSDPTLHNVHALPTANPEFNQGQPFQGMELEKTFDKAEVMMRFKCDVHPWMSAFMGVVNHPFFAVSGADGSFTIDNVPPGDYVLEAWHETGGTKTQNVTVTDGGDVAVAFDFSPAAG